MEFAKNVRTRKRERMQRRMKPELIYVDAYDGMVTMRKEELEALVEKAYQAGKSEGELSTITYPWRVSTTPYYEKAVDATCNTEGKG